MYRTSILLRGYVKFMIFPRFKTTCTLWNKIEQVTVLVGLSFEKLLFVFFFHSKCFIAEVQIRFPYLRYLWFRLTIFHYSQFTAKKPHIDLCWRAKGKYRLKHKFTLLEESIFEKNKPIFVFVYRQREKEKVVYWLCIGLPPHRELLLIRTVVNQCPRFSLKPSSPDKVKFYLVHSLPVDLVIHSAKLLTNQWHIYKISVTPNVEAEVQQCMPVHAGPRYKESLEHSLKVLTVAFSMSCRVLPILNHFSHKSL